MSDESDTSGPVKATAAPEAIVAEAAAPVMEAATPVLTPEQIKEANRKEAVRAFHDCSTKEEMRAAVEKYPVLKEIYSAGNWS